MTVAELLALVMDREWNLPRHARVLVGTTDGLHRWDIVGTHGRAGGTDPEVVLEIKLNDLDPQETP